jgi:hypothetical protein
MQLHALRQHYSGKLRRMENRDAWAIQPNDAQRAALDDRRRVRGTTPRSDFVARSSAESFASIVSKVRPMTSCMWSWLDQPRKRLLEISTGVLQKLGGAGKPRAKGSVPPSFFEAKYRANIDPWGFRNSQYDQQKYQATLDALSRRRYHQALE